MNLTLKQLLDCAMGRNIPSEFANENIDYEAELIEELKKSTLKTAVKNIVEKYNLNKNEVYQKALELKNG